jgi:hypothetical protein
MSDALSLAEALAKAVQLELSAIRREKEQDYALNNGGGPGSSDEELANEKDSSEEEEQEEDTVKAAQ